MDGFEVSVTPMVKTEIRLSDSGCSFEALGRVLPDTPSSAPLLDALQQFSSSPITGIHLWFDRQISDLDHAVLLDRTIQWMFHNLESCSAKSRMLNPDSQGKGGSYIELVVSCSRSLVEKSKTEIVEMAIREAQEFFPYAPDAYS